MDKSDVEALWNKKLSDEKAATEQLEASLVAITEFNIRKEAALERAEEILKSVDLAPNPNQNSPYEIKLSAPIPLGPLGELSSAGKGFGFANVRIQKDTSLEKIISQSRFTKKHTFERRVGKVNDITVSVGAGYEDGAGIEQLDCAQWTMTDRYNEESMTNLEVFLDLVEGVLANKED